MGAVATKPNLAEKPISLRISEVELHFSNGRTSEQICQEHFLRMSAGVAAKCARCSHRRAEQVFIPSPAGFNGAKLSLYCDRGHANGNRCVKELTATAFETRFSDPYDIRAGVRKDLNRHFEQEYMIDPSAKGRVDEFGRYHQVDAAAYAASVMAPSRDVPMTTDDAW
jgi:hypothetical protein